MKRKYKRFNKKLTRQYFVTNKFYEVGQTMRIDCMGSKDPMYLRIEFRKIVFDIDYSVEARKYMYEGVIINNDDYRDMLIEEILL